MKKTLFLFISFVWSFILFAQKVDTIVDKEAYYCYYSYSVKNPLYVVYHLYKGGGDCSRKGMYFISDSATATNGDYARTGFDRGHLANAEDFAYDCDKEKATFSFYNCLPQTPRLNRGIWKHWETIVRKESQEYHLKIICGGIFSDSNIIGEKVGVPKFCWKIVMNEDNNELLHCMIFPNDDSDTFENISLTDLQLKLGYTLNY